ncbi:hypothetical protein KIPB_002078, partial [Kipferlia bialata]
VNRIAAQREAERQEFVDAKKSQQWLANSESMRTATSMIKREEADAIQTFQKAHKQRQRMQDKRDDEFWLSVHEAELAKEEERERQRVAKTHVLKDEYTQALQGQMATQTALRQKEVEAKLAEDEAIKEEQRNNAYLAELEDERRRLKELMQAVMIQEQGQRNIERAIDERETEHSEAAIRIEAARAEEERERQERHAKSLRHQREALASMRAAEKRRQYQAQEEAMVDDFLANQQAALEADKQRREQRKAEASAGLLKECMEENDHRLSYRQAQRERERQEREQELREGERRAQEAKREAAEKEAMLYNRASQYKADLSEQIRERESLAQAKRERELEAERSLAAADEEEAHRVEQYLQSQRERVQRIKRNGQGMANLFG